MDSVAEILPCNDGWAFRKGKILAFRRRGKPHKVIRRAVRREILPCPVFLFIVLRHRAVALPIVARHKGNRQIADNLSRRVCVGHVMRGKADAPRHAWQRASLLRCQRFYFRIVKVFDMVNRFRHDVVGFRRRSIFDDRARACHKLVRPARDEKHRRQRVVRRRDSIERAAQNAFRLPVAVGQLDKIAVGDNLIINHHDPASAPRVLNVGGRWLRYILHAADVDYLKADHVFHRRKFVKAVDKPRRRRPLGERRHRRENTLGGLPPYRPRRRVLGRPRRERRHIGRRVVDDLIGKFHIVKIFHAVGVEVFRLPFRAVGVGKLRFCQPPNIFHALNLDGAVHEIGNVNVCDAHHHVFDSVWLPVQDNHVADPHVIGRPVRRDGNRRQRVSLRHKLPFRRPERVCRLREIGIVIAFDRLHAVVDLDCRRVLRRHGHFLVLVRCRGKGYADFRDNLRPVKARKFHL